MPKYSRAEHQIIFDVLEAMNHAFLLDNKCWFGRGTAIVLKLGEYRQSMDIDFLCSDVDGYRRLRMAAMGEGVRALFTSMATLMMSLVYQLFFLRTCSRRSFLRMPTDALTRQ